MRRTRRRRPRVVWLPNVGSPGYSGDTLDQNPSYIHDLSTITLGGGRIATLEFPLFQDNPPEQFAAAGTAGNVAIWQRSALASVQELGYRLRRIVGKLVIGVATPVDLTTSVTTNVAGLVVTAGLMVRRVDPEQGIAVATAPEVLANSLGTVRDPWIWRRSWWLRNSQLPPQTMITGSATPQPVPNDDETAITLNQPTSTASYGSVMDGPHVDAKTARRVGPEERVFLDITYRIPYRESGVPTSWDVATFFDYRGLATLSMNSGNRRNASR